VMPWLREHADGAFRERVLRCFGVPEATLCERIRDIDLGDVRLSYRVKFPEILLKLVAHASSEDEAERAVDAAANDLEQRLGDVVYGEGDESMAQVVGTLLREKGMTIATAESCTGGLLASLITDVVGASRYFGRGVVTYSNESKMELLGVSESTLKEHGAVSGETAGEMASGIRRSADASIGVSITGIAGPGGATDEKPLGTVYIAVSGPEGTKTQHFCFNRDRIWFKQMAAWTALDLVRKAVKSEE